MSDNHAILKELHDTFNEWLNHNPQVFEAQQPESERDSAFMLMLSPRLQEMFHDLENDTFFYTPKGVVSQFLTWCMSEKPTSNYLAKRRLRVQILITRLSFERIFDDLSMLTDLANTRIHTR